MKKVYMAICVLVLVLVTSATTYMVTAKTINNPGTGTVVHDTLLAPDAEMYMGDYERTVHITDESIKKEIAEILDGKKEALKFDPGEKRIGVDLSIEVVSGNIVQMYRLYEKDIVFSISRQDLNKDPDADWTVASRVHLKSDKKTYERLEKIYKELSEKAQ